MQPRELDIILTHERADFDALASMLGAARLFPEAVPVLPRQINRNVRDFLALYKDLFPFVPVDELPRGKVRRAILVDTRAVNSPKGTLPGTEYFIIDHHTIPAEVSVAGEVRKAIPNARELWSGATGANTTLLVEKLIENGVAISPIEATLLALGIYEDTGNLTYASTTHRDAAALAWLLDPERGVNLSEVHEFLHHPISKEQADLLQTLMANCEFLEISGYRIIVSTARAPGFNDELSTLAARLRDFHEPDALFIIVDLGDLLQVVARSTTDAVNVGKVTQALGGGGHRRAAAAHVRGVTLRQLHDRIIALIEDTSRATVTVRQIMSSGRPQMLDPDLPLKEASTLMRRWGHEGFPVVRSAEGRDQLLGVLTRRDADRALDHGLGDQPVHRFMRAGQVFVRPNDSITVLRRTMIDSDWGQVPVFEGDAIVGIVTRTDLIKLWDDTSLPEHRAAEISARLKQALNPVQHHLLQLVGQEVDELKYSVYVVGGFVRDLMLDHYAVNALSLDVDIVIEGDAITFAHRVQARYGGRVVEHKRFGTAKWQLDREDAPVDYAKLVAGVDGAAAIAALPSHLDFVTARTEFYTEPTVLPTIQQGSIKLDLHRRDFTINTMALCLNPDRWGELLDFWGGLNDLNAGLVRVLHSLSFVDDATRILRAVRYEQRFGFQIEQRTLELLNDALELLDRVTPARIRHELERILQEDTPERAMLRLDQLAILRHFHPELHMSAAMAAQFVRLRTLRAAPDADPELVHQPSERLYWGIVTYPLPRHVLQELEERFGLRSETKALMDSLCLLREKLWLLSDPTARPSQIVAALDGVQIAAIALLPVICEEPQALTTVKRYREEWRNVHAELNGHDLLHLGVRRGLIYRSILNELRAGRLDGTIRSRDDEIKYVRLAAAIE